MRPPRGPDPTAPEAGAGAPPGWRRRLPAWLRPHATLPNAILFALLVWAAPRLLPHLGALVGVESGEGIVPAYDYRLLDGTWTGSDSLRGKVVLVNFWATWCAPCRAEMPLLEQMARRHADQGFVVLGLAVDRASTAEVAAFVRDRGVTYPVAHVGPEAERTFGGVYGYPTSFLVDREGRVRHKVLGPVGPITLEPAVRRLLAEAAGRE